jgi:hypothetical protein
MTLVPYRLLRNSKFSLTTLRRCFYIWIRLVVDVRIIGDGLPVLLISVSFEVASVPEDSVLISAAPRREKNFGWLPPWGGGCLRRATFWSALSLCLKFSLFSQWRAASASVLLGNHLPALLVALWLLINNFGLLWCSPWARLLTHVKLLYKCHSGHYKWQNLQFTTAHGLLFSPLTPEPQLTDSPPQLPSPPSSRVLCYDRRSVGQSVLE